MLNSCDDDLQAGLISLYGWEWGGRGGKKWWDWANYPSSGMFGQTLSATLCAYVFLRVIWLRWRKYITRFSLGNNYFSTVTMKEKLTSCRLDAWLISNHQCLMPCMIHATMVKITFTGLTIKHVMSGTFRVYNCCYPVKIRLVIVWLEWEMG